MKARLLHHEGALRLLLCTGSIQDVSVPEAYTFLSNYDNPEYYAGNGKWDFEGLTMEAFRGSTIAVVNDDGTMTVFDAEWYRKILSDNETKYLTAQEYADLHQKKSAIIRRFCLSNRLPGAILKGNTWLIPENTPYPDDERVRMK